MPDPCPHLERRSPKRYAAIDARGKVMGIVDMGSIGHRPHDCLSGLDDSAYLQTRNSDNIDCSRN